MSNNPKSTKIVATAKFKDFAAYRSWWMSEDKDFEWMSNFMDTRGKEPGAGSYMPYMDRFFRTTPAYSRSTPEEEEKRKNERVETTRNRDIKNHLDRLEAMVRYSEMFNQPLNITYLTDTGAFICLGNPENGFYIPDPYEFLDIDLIPDYSELSIHEVRALAGSQENPATSTLPSNIDTSITVSQARSHVQALKDKAAQMEKELDDARNCRTGELAEMKAALRRMEEELYEKKSALMAELNAKKEEMEAKIDQMNRQVYLLESEIYSIRCYMGDTVSFAKIRSGKNAPNTEPVVLHQKIRFLDEDLARITSIYELDWSERDTFEHFLANSPTALDTFAPNERCVTLVRLSRTAKRYAPHEKIKNTLDMYEAYHGRSVGIIIRNGENLYFGWTDDEKVHIQDDFVMDMKARVVAADPCQGAEESEKEYKQRLKREQQEATRILDGIISRVFIFNILQGIVDNSNILPLPADVKISKQSEYVQFSLADLWLTDNRFGSFSDIVARCNSLISKGDYILSVQNLVGGRRSIFDRGPDTWHNDRGRGDRNRVRDCEVKDCTIYPINLIEQDEPYLKTHYLCNAHDGSGRWFDCYCTGDGSNLSEDAKIVETYECIDYHYFVSVEKEYSRAGARSNFEVYASEFINLTYLNSVWLSYAISTKNVGGWTVGGQAVDYAFAIRYLNTALDFIRKREVNEKAFLDEIDPNYTKKDPNWPLTLSEWKMSAGVRQINEYQAKRFIAHIKK